MELVEAKVRPVGNALGVIFPSQLVKREKLSSGQIISVTVLRKQSKPNVEKLFGITKGASSFERTRSGRD